MCSKAKSVVQLALAINYFSTSLTSFTKMAAPTSPKKEKPPTSQQQGGQFDSFFDKLGGTLARKKKAKEGNVAT